MDIWKSIKVWSEIHGIIKTGYGNYFNKGKQLRG